MNLKHLRHFVVLAETLHFGRAAERLHMTQPPLSRQIAAMEAELGLVLFERHSRSVVLTPAGQEFYQHSLKLLAQYAEAVRAARAAEQGERGELRVGFTMFAAWYAVPEILSAYQASYPQVRLRLKETLPRDLMAALANGDIDVGIGFPHPVLEPVKYEALYREPLCAALPIGHELAGHSGVQVASLSEQAFILSPELTAPELYSAVMRCCRLQGFEPDVRLEADLQQTIVNLVARGMGVALVPQSMQTMQVDGVRFVPIDEPDWIEQGMFWNASQRDPCLSHFLEQARQVVF